MPRNGLKRSGVARKKDGTKEPVGATDPLGIRSQESMIPNDRTFDSSTTTDRLS